MEIAARHSRAEVVHDVLVLPDGTSAQAVVTFRIPNSLLVFKQERDGFVADVEVTVELLRNGVKIADQIWRDEHHASAFASTQSRTDDVDGWVRFQVDPGKYTYRLMMDSPAMDERDGLRAFEVTDYTVNEVGPLVFGVLHRDSQRVSLDPTALGGSVPFGKDVPVIVPVVGEVLRSDADGSGTSGTSGVSGVSSNPGDSDVTADVDEGHETAVVFTYHLYRAEDTGRNAAARGNRRQLRAERAAIPEPIEISRNDVLITTGSAAADALVPIGAFLESDDDCICWSSPTAGTNYLAVLPLETGQLENGTYKLGLTPARGGPSTTFMFSTLWRDMPFSLYDVEVAIRHLEFIENRETVRAMLKGSSEVKMEAFKSYWDDRDPTPETVFNELMYEYYRRIDDAAFRFRTGQLPYPDGLRTDAAHIYVVYGPPDDIASSLPPSGGVEQTWTYADGRRFIFRAASSLDPLELQERAMR